jgi:hypothetical protein
MTAVSAVNGVNTPLNKNGEMASKSEKFHFGVRVKQPR